MSIMEALRVILGGRVQGVGFRYFTVEKARFHRLVGFVRNLPDGQVEATRHRQEAGSRGAPRGPETRSRFEPGQPGFRQLEYGSASRLRQL